MIIVLPPGASYLFKKKKSFRQMWNIAECTK